MKYPTPLKALQMATLSTIFFLGIVCMMFGRDEVYFIVPLNSMYDVRNIARKSFQQRGLPLRPQCDNLLENMTTGLWQLTSPNDTKHYDNLLRRYWRKRGISVKQWRDDGRCGYSWLLPEVPNSTWPRTGSWCDPTSDTPCCSNRFYGRCIRSDASTCTCPACVDLRKYEHAEVSKWRTSDVRCSWVNYTGVSACKAIERSIFRDIYLVGDSFMRHMFVTLLMLLSDDPVRGSWKKGMTDELRKKCLSDQFYFWKECRHSITSLEEVANPQALCGGREPRFNITMKPYYNPKFKDKFLDLVRNLTGKAGTLVVVGVGFHMQCEAEKTLNSYLGPAVKHIENFYRHSNNSTRWPQIFFVMPMPLGLLKPPVFLSLQNDVKIKTFAKHVRQFCALKQIPVFDFRQLAEHVHSFDGTHYGMSVNLMKNQVLLNFIASSKLAA